MLDLEVSSRGHLDHILQFPNPFQQASYIEVFHLVHETIQMSLLDRGQRRPWAKKFEEATGMKNKGRADVGVVRSVLSITPYREVKDGTY